MLQTFDMTGLQPKRLTKSLYQDTPFRVYVFSWSARWGLGWGLAVGAGVALVALIFDTFWTTIPAGRVFWLGVSGGLFAFGFAFSLGLKFRAEEFDEMQQIEDVEFERPSAPVTVAHDPQRLRFDLANGLGTVEVWQPRPGAFRQWLREVLENDRTQFSARQGLSRGWDEQQYTTLIHQLRGVGLLHNETLFNGAPVLTDRGKELAEGWLKK